MKASFERKGKILLTAYDHGIEHGPSDFNQENVNPEKVLSIAEKAGIGIVLQKGLAEKYSSPYDVPLVVKLNGKTCMGDSYYSPQICSVDQAASLGADAIGYTIYPGSPAEGTMFEKLGKIHERAREHSLPIITWSYPRGEGINEHAPETVAYAARVSLELGSDYVKVKYPGSKQDLNWVVANSGKQKVLCSGGGKMEENEFEEKCEEVMAAGASGMVIGRNIWQRENSVKFVNKIKNIIW